MSGGINTSDLYSTMSLWSRRVDSTVHKLDGFPHGVMFLLLWRDRKYVRPARKILRKRGFDELSPFLCSLEKWSRQNRTSHPHWVKICDDHNGQINLRAKQKYKVLSAPTKFGLLKPLNDRWARGQAIEFGDQPQFELIHLAGVIEYAKISHALKSCCHVSQRQN